ncbi:MAG: PilZ domain-containing protein [Candidatus Aminicenantes bacterium]|nr:PilZ domain-containing protein [Candidatus Aminicenantes bacterium]
MKRIHPQPKIQKKKALKKTAPKLPASVSPLDRRREWRLRLPLQAVIHGRLPRGEKFQEESTIENISSTGAYFCLDSGVAVGSKLNVMIELPSELGGGKTMRLLLGGITIRLEEVNAKSKRQGVAMRFKKDYRVIPNK